MFSKTLKALRLTPAVLFLALLSSGCTSLGEYVSNRFKVGPNYQKPPADTAADWIDGKSRGINVAKQDIECWWTGFNDPVLNKLVETAYNQNLDVRTAGTRILEARAQRNISRGFLLPQLQEAFAEITRNQTSRNAVFTPPIQFFDNNAVGFNLQWEIDFWGRFRRALEASNAELDASVENYDDVLVLLISEVAASYVQIRTQQQRIAFAEANIAIQKKLADDASERFKGKAVDESEPAQMRSNLYDTMALREQLEIGLRVANNKLCFLLGISPRDLLPELGPGPIPGAPPEIAIGIPADLLRRRPDVRRAERQVAAQSARIGVATSELYPHISLIGTLGYQSQNFAQLISPGSGIGTIGPSLRWDILNYGRLLNAIRVEDAKFQGAALVYQNTVLRAGREVEDGIVTFLRSQEQAIKLLETEKDAKTVVRVIGEQRKQGAKVDINREFVTTNFLVTQQDKLAQAKGDIALGLIQIYRALGGGWEIRTGNCAPGSPEQLPAPKDKAGRVRPFIDEPIIRGSMPAIDPPIQRRATLLEPESVVPARLDFLP